jgi:hypothetical protein
MHRFFYYTYWLFIWAILYKLRIVTIQPLYELLIFALFFSTFLLLYFKITKISIVLISILIHIIPLIIIKKKKNTKKDILINFIVILIYNIFLLLNGKTIMGFYTERLRFIKNNNISEIIFNSLFSNNA